MSILLYSIFPPGKRAGSNFSVIAAPRQPVILSRFLLQINVPASRHFLHFKKTACLPKLGKICAHRGGAFCSKKKHQQEDQ
jgi:hypothetical protein